MASKGLGNLPLLAFTPLTAFLVSERSKRATAEAAAAAAEAAAPELPKICITRQGAILLGLGIFFLMLMAIKKEDRDEVPAR